MLTCSRVFRYSTTRLVCVRNLSTNETYGDKDKSTASLNTKKRYNKPPPISLSKIRMNRENKSEEESKKNSANKSVAIVFMGLPLIAFGLGVWQIKRREWKLELIAMLEARQSTPVRELPTDLSDLKEFIVQNEFCPFRVKGHFLNSREVLITIRSDLTQTYNEPGGHVVTPFVLSDRPDIVILVNRGYVPHTHYSPATRQETTIEQEVELVGLLRTSEIGNRFSIKNKPPLEWHTRDVNAMAQSLETLPIFLDQIDKKRSYISKDLPVPNQSAIKVRNEHMNYIITWFTLSALTSILWWRRFAKVLF